MSCLQRVKMEIVNSLNTIAEAEGLKYKPRNMDGWEKYTRENSPASYGRELPGFLWMGENSPASYG